MAGRAARALADACAKARILRLVHVSTAVVVGDSASSVIDEKTPCDPATAYELAKFQVERLLMEKARDAFELVILRPTAVFGPGEIGAAAAVGDHQGQARRQGLGGHLAHGGGTDAPA